MGENYLYEKKPLTYFVSKQEAIGELLKLTKIDNKIKAIQKVADNNILEAR